MDVAVWVIIAVVVVVLIAFVVMYNNLIQLKNRCKNAWAQTDVQLQRRHDLIPNLVEAVKGYAKHESGTLDAVVKARNAAMGAHGGAEQIKAENALTSSLKSLFALAEAYPELKANENFLDLQRQLQDTEDKLSYARQSYNDCVMAYDNAREQFPSNIVCGMFGATFTTFASFDAPVEAQAAPIVRF